MYRLVIILLFIVSSLSFAKYGKIYENKVLSADTPKTVVVDKVLMTSTDSVNFVCETSDTVAVKLLGIPVSMLGGIPLGDTLTIFNDTLKAYGTKVINKTYARFQTKYVYFKYILTVRKLGTPVNSFIHVYYYKREDN